MTAPCDPASGQEPDAGPVLGVEEVVGVLREWAGALRGSWGRIDGRECRGQLDVIADALLAADDGGAATTLAHLRWDAGICPRGEDGWLEDCGHAEPT